MSTIQSLKAYIYQWIQSSDEIIGLILSSKCTSCNTIHDSNLFQKTTLLMGYSNEAQVMLYGANAGNGGQNGAAFVLLHPELHRKGMTLALLWQENLDRGNWSLSYGQVCRLRNTMLRLVKIKIQ